MDRDGADDVVDLQLVDHRDGDDDERRADAADDDRVERELHVRARRDGDQAAQRAVQRHRQIHFLVEDLRHDRGDDHAGRSRKVGVDEDDRHRAGVKRAAQRELRAAVEAEPAEPKDERPERGERQIGAGHRMDGAVRRIFAFPRAEHDRAGEGRPAADRMHDRRTGEVAEAHFRQPAAAPSPGRRDRIDEAGQRDREDQEGPDLHAFGDRARHDRRRRGDEHHLEVPVRHHRIAAVGHRGDHLVGGVVGVDQGQFRRSGVVEQRESADVTRHVDIHQIIPDEVIHDAGGRIQSDVLQADRSGVLGAHQAAFQHAEARGHEHHEEAADEEHECVEDECGLGRHRRKRGAGRRYADAERRAEQHFL